jgi:hypothetical protein
LHIDLKIREDCVVIRPEESTYEIKSAAGLGHFLTEKVLRPQLFKKLISKEKHGATFPTLEKNECSKKILIDQKSKKSDAFRFPVAATADVLASPANIERWYHKPRDGCYHCHKDYLATLPHILNACN